MERLQKYIKPGMGIAIENMCGKQLEINWLEDRFWMPFRDHTARHVAGTLRHIRSKAINISDYIPDSEIYRWPHDKIVQLEFDTAKRDIHYLRNLIANCKKES